jgi:transcriptional regulator with XRE-family HTH domain/predicted RNase H-like HicB family nuclease
MQYTALITKAGKQTLAEFPGCPGCQTFADPGEDIVERAEEALVGWLEAHLVSGQAPPEPTTVRSRGRAQAVQVSVPAALGITLAVRWARRRAGISQAELARRAGLSQPVVARLEDPDHNPTLATLERVAAALGARLDVGLRPGPTLPASPGPGREPGEGRRHPRRPSEKTAPRGRRAA